MNLFSPFKFSDFNAHVLVKYTGKKECVVLPDHTSKISRDTFKGNSIMKEIVLPERLTEIGERAFMGCTSLEKISFPSTLKEIGNSAFSGCIALKELTLPEGTLRIGPDAFRGCESLKALKVPEGGVELGTEAFQNCRGLEYVSIPDDARLSCGVFRGCNHVLRIDCGSTVKEKIRKEQVWPIFDKEIIDTLLAQGQTGQPFDYRNAELELQYKTRSENPAYGKNNLFLHASMEDSARFDRIAGDILGLYSGLNYTVWSAKDPRAVFENTNSPDLARMAVFMPLITTGYIRMFRRYASENGDRCGFSLADLNEKGVTVVPIILEEEAENDFNRTFGNLHCLKAASPDQLRSKIEKYLNDYFGSQELREEILRDAFGKKLFLSYRKIDRAQALTVMKAIHDTEHGKTAAIWFDDFLYPGNDFNNQIAKELNGCDAMVLNVTPNILNEGNYVLETEYPNAKKLLGDDRIIPLETVETDKDALERLYAFRECIDPNESVRLDERLAHVPGKEKQISPYGAWLLAMAFLNGICTEIDVQRAVSLLKFAGDHGIWRACRQLGFLYISGTGVKRDTKASISWKYKAYQLLVKEVKASACTDEGIYEDLYELIFGEDGLELTARAYDNSVDINGMIREYISLISKARGDFGGTERQKMLLHLAEAYDSISDLHFDAAPDTARIREAEEAAKNGFECLGEYEEKDSVEAKYIEARLLYNQGEILERRGDVGSAQEKYEKSESTLDALIHNGASEQAYRKTWAGVAGKLGLIYRENAIRQSMRNPFQSIELMQPATRMLGRVLTVERDLVREIPTISNREGLAIALENYGLVLTDRKETRACFAEALEIVQKLQKETADGSFNEFEAELLRLNKRK